MSFTLHHCLFSCMHGVRVFVVLLYNEFSSLNTNLLLHTTSSTSSCWHTHICTFASVVASLVQFMYNIQINTDTLTGLFLLKMWLYLSTKGKPKSACPPHFSLSLWALTNAVMISPPPTWKTSQVSDLLLWNHAWPSVLICLCFCACALRWHSTNTCKLCRRV